MLGTQVLITGNCDQEKKESLFAAQENHNINNNINFSYTNISLQLS